MPKFEWLCELSELSLIDVFCEMFYHELDSWFSADIICCDECYDKLVSKWPGIYFRNLDFQKSCIDIKTFYSGSMLQDFFYEEECLQLIKNIECPSCGNPIWNNIWAYNFSLDIVTDFEEDLKKINDLAKRTPFLLLSNSLAKDTLDVIIDMSKKTKSIMIDKKYYRARKLEKEKLYESNDFKYAPKDKVTEGRYNHAGFPAIYLGNSLDTCFYELRKPTEGIAVAEINITKPIKILDLIEIEEDWDNILNVISWSSLMSSPDEGEGWYKPQYTFTRFVADCAIYAGFDAIKYPSVRLGENHNIVILDGINGWDNLKVKRIKKLSAEKIIKQRI